MGFNSGFKGLNLFQYISSPSLSLSSPFHSSVLSFFIFSHYVEANKSTKTKYKTHSSKCIFTTKLLHNKVGNVRINVKMGRVRITTVALEKQYYIFCVCVCVCAPLVIQHAEHMCRILLWCVACPALEYFSTLSHKQHNFRKKKLLHINVCCHFFYNSV